MRKMLNVALVLAGAFLFAPVASAQFTTVTATVQDPNGIPYAGAVLNAVLVPGASGGYRLGGQPYSGQIGPVTLDSSGKFTVNFGDVTLITPGSPQWQITISSAAATIGLPLGTGPQQFTFTSTGTTISGSSPVSLTTALNALAPKLTNFTSAGSVSGTGTANFLTGWTGTSTVGNVTNWQWGTSGLSDLLCSNSATCDLFLFSGALTGQETLLQPGGAGVSAPGFSSASVDMQAPSVGNASVTFTGATSGTAAISVPSAAGTPCTFLLPTTSATTSGQMLSSAPASGGNCQTSWAAVGGSTGQTLLRLANAAQNSNPLINPSLGPAPTWAASTAYATGQVVTNGLYQYICNVAGTSASSGGPTGTGANLITDNTVSWYYYGLAQPGSASVNQPSITTSASVPGGLTQTIAMNASPSPFYYTGGTPVTTGSGQYNLKSLYQIGTTTTSTAWRVTFVTDAQKIAAKTTSAQNATRYVVDGQYVTVSGYVNGTGATPSYNVIDFTNAGTRKVHTITLEMGANTQFGGISIGPTEEAWAPKTQDRIRVIWIADSISSGGGNSPSVYGGDTPYQVGLLLGWSDVWDASQGGIGYINTNSGTGYTYQQQLSNFVVANGYTPNVLVFAGGQNDPAAAGYSTGAETTAVTSALTAARTAYPSVPIIVLGVFPGSTGPNATYIALETAIQAGVTAFADSNTYFIPITNDPVQAWMTGTGRVNATTGTGNSDVYTSADNVHPTDMGRIYQAQRMAQAIRNVLPSIP